MTERITVIWPSTPAGRASVLLDGLDVSNYVRRIETALDANGDRSLIVQLTAPEIVIRPYEEREHE